MGMNLNLRERRLIERFRLCDERGKASIESMSATQLKALNPERSDRPIVEQAPTSEKGVVIQVSRFPKNIGHMLNRFIAGDVISLHMVGVTREGGLINTSTSGIPDDIRRHDSF